MAFRFDHLVHIVWRPEETAEQLRGIGLAVRPGGEHERWGTYNELSYFGLSYLELLGVRHPALAAKTRDNDLVRQTVDELPSGEKFARLALRTDRIEEEAERFRSQRLRVTGPFPGSRRRADGSLLAWSMLFLEWPDGHGPPLPFVIQWGESDEERLGRLNREAEQAPHLAGELKLTQVAFAVRDAGETAEEWARLFGLQAGVPAADPSLRAHCRTLALPGGELLFCSPAGTGQVADALNRHGEGPFLVRLAGAGEKSRHEVSGGIYEFI
ncbi:hypothetical protein J31TS4_45390 [Paenibacillus sp. J31TS4]|uniref:VOC family protein n=1 Tax=Paenibacillus sp. J31TS4 TaxID=2807195 RepID=UPI001B2576F3|nr:VOC family protein [Paenibacillus sp. J31TS4]GIP41259.1 hypothetical protein J31TS4_45390 [Paenibacillus sp. J31TS4]